MKKILFAFLGVIIFFLTWYFVSTTYSFMFPEHAMCAEGCSSSFKKILLGTSLGFIALFGWMGYGYKAKVVSLKRISTLYAICLLILFFIAWYSTGYGYGLNYSY
ncbi:MAG: hypothetical protein KAZ18_00310 [Acinetobacter sp.]|nr:hypothetical protein [Acinetobacter sp.]